MSCLHGRQSYEYRDEMGYFLEQATDLAFKMILDKNTVKYLKYNKQSNEKGVDLTLELKKFKYLVECRNRHKELNREYVDSHPAMLYVCAYSVKNLSRELREGVGTRSLQERQMIVELGYQPCTYELYRKILARGIEPEWIANLKPMTLKELVIEIYQKIPYFLRQIIRRTVKKKSPYFDKIKGKGEKCEKEIFSEVTPKV